MYAFIYSFRYACIYLLDDLFCFGRQLGGTQVLFLTLLRDRSFLMVLRGLCGTGDRTWVDLVKEKRLTLCTVSLTQELALNSGSCP